MKLINAGLKSKDELVRRLVDGDVFYYKEDCKIYYDTKRIGATFGSHFIVSTLFKSGRSGLSPMSNEFDEWINLMIEKKPDCTDDLVRRLECTK